MEQTFIVVRIEEYLTSCTVTYEVKATTPAEARAKLLSGEYENAGVIEPIPYQFYDTADAHEVSDFVTVIDEDCNATEFHGESEVRP